MQKPVIFLAFANDKVDYARYLRNLPIELDGIRKSLQDAQQAGLCEVIERANATIEQILDIFQQYRDRVAVFHYGGHADGYQLLLENLDGSHAVAKGEGLVSFLARQKGLKLIFFNGCSTQQQSLELLEAGLPAVVGTSNSINDEVATALAIRFYKGIGSGATLERAWNEAVDQLKIEFGSDQMKKLYRLKKEETVPDQFPWNLLIKEGAEGVKEWNLPDAVNNPLYALPPIPQTHQLPESPFLFLKRYERQHAEVFFGRSYYIRDLYNKITDVKTPPVVLFYGQSGTGKSSLFDAGLNPRLEGSHVVLYMRREQEKGLLETLEQGLAKLLEESTKENRQVATAEEKEKNGLSEEEFLAKRKALVEELTKQLQNLADSEKIDLRNTIHSLEKEILQKPVAIPLGSTEFVYIHDLDFETQFGENNPHFKIWRMWHDIELLHNKPLVVTLDQVEEVFTRPNKVLSNELGVFLQSLQVLFTVLALAPHGTLILGYRKEYHAEIEERFKEYAIPRSRQFFEVLSRKEILDIFEGLSKTPALQKRYNLSVDANLPVIIADDLLEDKESPVAPVLQILLTKMWDRVRNDAQPHFSVELYQNLKREGFLLDDFFYQQMEKFKQWNAEIEKSGLPLDILFFHTTELRTATGHYIGKIRERYAHIPELAQEVVNKLRELYLLVDSGEEVTNLTHDTIAPLIRREFRGSERAGQRAARLLDSQMDAYEDDKTRVFDEVDLDTVELGKNAMRYWNTLETELIEASRREKAKLQQHRIRSRNYVIITISLILVTAVFSLYQWTKAHRNTRRATVKELVLLSSDKVKKDNLDIQQDGVRLAEAAYQMRMSVEWEDRTKACDNFRKACETYRKTQFADSRWDAPYREINFRHIQGLRLLQQIEQQQQSNLFEPFDIGKGGNGGRKGADPINYALLPDSLPPEEVNLINKFTQDDSRLVTLIEGHSFRIESLNEFEKPYIIRTAGGDSTIRDFMPTNGDHWFIIEKNNDIKLLNIKTLEKKTILIADSFRVEYPYQLLKATETELVYWHHAFLFRLSQKEAGNWENPTLDTLLNLSTYGNGFGYASDVFAKAWFSQDLSKMMFKSQLSFDTLLAVSKSEKGNYQIRPIHDPFLYQTMQDFSADGNHLVILENGKMTLFKIDWAGQKLDLEEVFGKRFLNTRGEPIVSFVPASQTLIMVQFNNSKQIRFYNFAEEVVDVLESEYHPKNDLIGEKIAFSHDGRYMTTRDQNKIYLRRPANALSAWLAKIEVPELDVREKISYQISTLEEEIADGSPLRSTIFMQIVALIGVLVMLIRYFPKSIELFGQKRYFKLIIHGGGVTTAFVFLFIYNEVMGENNASESYAIVSILFIPFAMLLSLFDGRAKLLEYLRTKNWFKLLRKTIPELAVIMGCFMIVNMDLTDDSTASIYLALIFVCLFNFLMVWLIHKASLAFEASRYIAFLGFLFFPTMIILGILAFIFTITISEYEIYFLYAALLYLLLWFFMWLRQKLLNNDRFRHWFDKLENKFLWN